MFKKILFFSGCFFGSFLFFIHADAASYNVKSFSFLGAESTNYYQFGLLNYQTLSGTFSVYVDDITQAKPYVNLYIATTNAMFEGTFSSSDLVFSFQKLDNASLTINGYVYPVYVMQVNLLGSWNCSAQGLNCTYSSTFSMRNYYNYQTAARVFSVVTTDERMNPQATINVTADMQGVIDAQNQTNQKLDQINSTLNDTTPPSSDISSLGNVQGLLPPGPVDSLLNIPAQFLSVVVSSVGGECKPLSGTWVYDQSLTFPCFDQIIWDDFEDDTLLKFLELIPCGFILILYFKHLYKKVERATSMNTNTDDEWGVI